VVRNAKKAEIIKSKIKGSDLNAIAATFAQTVSIAENVNYGSASLNDGDQEPILVGKIFAAKPGTIVGPVAGNSGVFVAKLTSITPATIEAGSFSQKMMLTQMARMKVNYALLESLKKNKKIEDNRFTFF